MRIEVLALVGLLVGALGLGAGTAHAQVGDGLTAPRNELTVWPRWQARLAAQATLLEAMADVYLHRHAEPEGGRWSGGLRASGGLLVDTVAEALDDDASAPMRLHVGAPRAWLGVGYSAASAPGDWALAADLGVTLWRADAAWPAQSLLGPRAGRGFGTEVARLLQPSARLSLRLRF